MRAKRTMTQRERAKRTTERVKAKAVEAVPTNWCDSLLTGLGGIGKPPWNCPEVEKLLLGVAARIRAIR